MVAAFSNIIGSEINTGTGTSAPYVAPSNTEVGSNTTDIATLQGQVAAINTAITALQSKIRTVTSASVTPTASDKTILADATAAAITINLPAVASNVNRIITVKKIDVSANIVTLDGNSSETIDGATTQVISVQWNSITVQSDGSAWYRI